MRLSRLEISGVRNVSSLAIECNANLNLFVGPNGAGKSAILESIYLLARGRSFR
jgi:DNA replication and repair protein RecF